GEDAGRHDLALGVDDLSRGLADAPDGGDASVADRDVRAIARKSGSVDHRAVLDDQVVRHRVLLIQLDSRLASDGGAPAPRRLAARKTIRRFASDGGAPAPRRLAARKTIRRLAS